MVGSFFYKLGDFLIYKSGGLALSVKVFGTSWAIFGQFGRLLTQTSGHAVVFPDGA